MRVGKLGLVLLLALTPAYVRADCDGRPTEVALLRVDSCGRSTELVMRKVAGLRYPEESLAALVESTKRVVVMTARYIGSSSPFPPRPGTGTGVETQLIDPRDRTAKKFALVDSLASCDANYANRERRFVIDDPPPGCCRDVNPPAYETVAECVLRLPTVRPLIAP